MLRNFMFLLFTLFLMGFGNASYALPFNIVVKNGTQLPTVVNKGSTVTAYYTVNNLSVAQQNNNFVKYLPPNVTQVTANGAYSDTCGATFNLAGQGKAGDSCTLQLTVSGVVDGSVADTHQHLFVCLPTGLSCAGTAQSLNVTQSSARVLQSITVTPGMTNLTVGGTQQYAASGSYSDSTTTDLSSEVTWVSSNTATATISATGLATAIAVGSTSITANFAGVTSAGAVIAVDNPMVSLAVTPTTPFGRVGGSVQLVATATFADSSTQDVSTLAAWTSATTSVATVGASTGLVTGVANGSSSISASYNTFSNSANYTVTNFTYIGNSSRVAYCPVNTDGTLGACATAASGFSNASGVLVNHANTALYVSDISGAGSILYCPFAGNGSLGTCTVALASAGEASGLAINPAGTMVYVATTVTVKLCTVSGATLTGCAATGTGYHGPTSVAVNAANTFAFVGNAFTGTVLSCSINSSNGSFTTCTQTASGFTVGSILGLGINSSGTFLYVGDPGGSDLQFCSINTGTGALTGCTATGNVGSQAYGIAINAADTIAYVAGLNCPINGNGSFGTCVSNGAPAFYGIAISP